MGWLRLGTSGWNYRHWRGRFYPPGLPSGRWLAYYARQFDTVEVNYSFYRLPTVEQVGRWRAAVPPGFVFAVKGSRFLTHVRRLVGVEEGLAKLVERLRPLGEQAGPLLWQLPPGMEADPGRLEAFLAALPRSYRHTVEFRHASWHREGVYGLLAKYGCALCIADRPDLPRVVRLTADWSYLRFHQGEAADGHYPEGQLRWWAEQIQGLRGAGAGTVYAYFNNDWEGFAVGDARRLRELLGEG